jgi:hypothetical protein
VGEPPRAEVVRRFFTHDDFSNGFARNWRAQGKFGYQWTVKEDPKEHRYYLPGPRNADPVLSIDNPPGNCVVSVLLRPNSKGTFGIGLRVPGNGKGIELRNNGESVRVYVPGRDEPLIDEPLPNSTPKAWYWHDLGVRTIRRGPDIEIRLRVYDQSRETLLASGADYVNTLKYPAIPKNGVISLFGPADFAEVYADPWSVRWTDPGGNVLIWDTSQVPDGKYYLFAEAIDDTGKVSLVRSDYQVEVRNPRSQSQDRTIAQEPVPNE